MSELVAGKRGLIMGLEGCQEKREPLLRPASRPSKNGDGGKA